ncbi:MAG: 16S rRNA processing protein RimM [Lachnospiraceae bacterium]|nr:16S rRNA processing protein RimM [Lachnospiraceae bacterium]
MMDAFRIGVVIKTHGLKGEVKVFPTTGEPKRFRGLKEVQVRTGDREEVFPVDHVRFFKNQIILKLKGIDRIEEAERLRKAELFVSREAAIPLGQNEYYVPELLDMKVFTEDEELLGVITEVLTGRANDVYVVTSEDGHELLLPAIRQCILNVDTEERKMTVHLMKGLTS